MALDCVLTPPSLDQGNKDTKLQTDGEIESDKPEDDEETDIDLEEGEILDSGEDEQPDVPLPSEQCSTQILHNENDEYCNNEMFQEENEEDRWSKRKKRRNEEEKKEKRSNKKARYIDHDEIDEENSDFNWHMQSISSTKRRNRRDASPQNEGNLSAHSENEEEPNFRDLGDKRHRGNGAQNRNNRKGRGAIRRQRMVQDRNKGKKRKGSDSKRSKSSIRNRPMREPRPPQICRYYLEGKCHKKNDCKFSHDTTQLKKKDLCKFFLNGFCAKGDACLFMHGDFPCKFFHFEGKCFFENGCRFSHEPLTDEMRMVLKRNLENGTLDEDKDTIESNANLTSQMKRPSLLGSPPRHVKEAAEEWQQDLIQRLQLRDKKIDFGCHNAAIINNSPIKQQQQFARPGNFYVDTLPRTPIKNEMREIDMGGPMMGDGMCPQMGDMSVNMNANMNGDLMNNMMGNMNGTRLGDMMGNMVMDINGPRMGDMVGNMMGDMNGPRMGEMPGTIMGDINCPRMGEMTGNMMGNMNRPRMGDMPNNMMSEVNVSRLGNIPGNVFGDHNGPRIGDMMRNNFQMPFMNQELLNQDRGDMTPPRNMRTPVPNDEDDEAREFDQFFTQSTSVQRLRSAVPPNDFYDDDEDVVVAGGIDELEDDQFSERIQEVKKTAVLSSLNIDKTQEDGYDSESQSTIISQNLSQSPPHDETSSETILTKPPIAIPVHLPKRTRELFLRIQQHQKKAGSNPNPDGDGTSDSQDKDGEESGLSQDKSEEKLVCNETPEICPSKSLEIPEAKTEIIDPQDEEYIDEEEKKNSLMNFLSSDDDDDNGDQPLTDVLKKLQQMPPPARVTTPPKTTMPSAPIDITKMLNNIRQQATQSTSNSFAGNKNFWQNIFSAAMPFQSQNPKGSQQNLIPSSLLPNQAKMFRNKICDSVNPKSGGLLPPPLLPHPPPSLLIGPMLMQQQMLNKIQDGSITRDPRCRDSKSKLEKSVDLKKVPTGRDPRLSARDPRMTTTTKEETNSPSSNGSKTSITPNTKIVTNAIKSPSPPHHSTHSKPKEKRQSIEKQDLDKKPAIGSPNYKLYTVTVSPLNYSSYLFATQNDKKLLNDPRLKKLIENSPTASMQTNMSLTFPPDLPSATLIKEKSVIGSPPSLSDPPKPQSNVAKTLQEIRTTTTRNILKKRNSTDSSTSPLPVKLLEQTDTSCLETLKPQLSPSEIVTSQLSPSEIAKPQLSPSEIVKPQLPSSETVKPQLPPISHLPKSFTDPRLVRLHQINSRRSHHMAIPKKKSKLTLPKPLDNKDPETNVDKELKDKPELKGGSVNRRRSLDYASPLNAYPESENTSSYSSYNRRPQLVNRIPKTIENPEPPPLSINIPIPANPEPITDISSEIESNLTNQSLKEVFKTKDPTASPFC